MAAARRGVELAFRRADYPSDWEAIRERVGERSGWRCEGSPLYPQCRAEHGKSHPVTGSKVVLTVAHYPDSDKRIGDLAGLKHWCNRCHLAMDRPHHLRVQAENRLKRRYGEQPPLPFDQNEPEVWRPIDRKALASVRDMEQSGKDRGERASAVLKPAGSRRADGEDERSRRK